MPTYKNLISIAPDTPVWHYTSLEAVVAMLRDRQLRLTRLDAFPDPFEGSVPKKQIDDQIPIFGGAQAAEMMMQSVASWYPEMQVPQRRNRDRWQEMTQRRKAKRRSAHAICWGSGEESDVMWRLYCKDGGTKGQGLALRSTLAKLEASFAAHDVLVGPVKYRLFHEGDAFTDELDPFMHKRKGFEGEREVRVLSYDDTHYQSLANYLLDESAGKPPDELPEHKFLDWSLPDAIDAITISPYASEAYEAEVRLAIAVINPQLDELMELSALSERRYPVNF